MPGLLDFMRSNSGSADSARKRLQLVLIHDRINLPAGQMEQLKDEMIKVISKYVDIDRSKASVTLENDGREQRLLMNIPLTKDRNSG